MPAIKTHTRAGPAAHSPGRARFHGNGIGGGADISRRTASMTDVTKPGDGMTLLLGQNTIEIVAAALAFIEMGSSAVLGLLAAGDDCNLVVPTRVGTERLRNFLADGNRHDCNRRVYVDGGHR